jgi:hypothetical protein
MGKQTRFYLSASQLDEITKAISELDPIEGTSTLIGHRDPNDLQIPDVTANYRLEVRDHGVTRVWVWDLRANDEYPAAVPLHHVETLIWHAIADQPKAQRLHQTLCVYL